MQDEELFHRPTHVPHVESADGAVLKVAAAGQLVGRYELVEIVGRGGMGEVWRAVDPHRSRPVVVKFLPAFLRGNQQELERIRETFHRVEALQHQHICPIYDFGEDDELGPYLVMKYLPGKTLNSMLRHNISDGSLPSPKQVSDLLLPIADALDYSHSNGVIHRDVKPDNIMVDEDSLNPQLVDFGIADEVRDSRVRLTIQQDASDTSGTRAYMATEVWRGESGDAFSDQYSLGVVAYELLSGRLPFRSTDLALLRLSVLNDAVEAIPASTHVNETLAKMLSKSAADRFSSCREAIASLQTERPAPSKRTRQVQVVSVGILLASIAVVACFQPWDADSDTDGISIESSTSVDETSVSLTPISTNPPEAFENSLGMSFVPVPLGAFEMGSPNGEDGHSVDEVQQTIEITKPFYMAAFEVTQAQYLAVMKNNPSHFSAAGDGAADVAGQDTASFPVEGVTWLDAKEFCETLSALPAEAQAGRRYRLPLEHEWEYACRAGSKSAHSVPHLDSSGANIGNELGRTVQVGSYPPNAFGIHDCHGNVWEWCQNSYTEHYEITSSAESSKRDSGVRAFRGGGWRYSAVYSRSAYRERFVPTEIPHQFTVGLRVVCEID